MKHVLIDVDGVMSEFTQAFTRVACELGKVSMPWRTYMQPTWNFQFHVDPVWREIDIRMNWWTTLEPLTMQWEIDLLNEKMQQNHFFFVINRNATLGANAEEQTEFWLRSIGVLFPLVIATPDKAKVAEECDIDIAIEDKPANIEALREAGVKTVVRRWEYNKDVMGPGVKSLGQFLQEYLDD